MLQGIHHARVGRPEPQVVDDVAGVDVARGGKYLEAANAIDSMHNGTVSKKTGATELL